MLFTQAVVKMCVLKLIQGLKNLQNRLLPGENSKSMSRNFSDPQMRVTFASKRSYLMLSFNTQRGILWSWFLQIASSEKNSKKNH